MMVEIRHRIRQIDAEIQQILHSCVELESLAGAALKNTSEWNRTGPFSWRESCDRATAIPRDVVCFDIALRAESVTTGPGTYQLQLSRSLPSNMVFDRVCSVTVDGKQVRPENQSLHRSLYLAFNRIDPDSLVQISYQVRVSFDSEPSRIMVGDTNLKWNWIACDEAPAENPGRKADSMLRADPKMFAIGRMHLKQPTTARKAALSWQREPSDPAEFSSWR